MLKAESSCSLDPDGASRAWERGQPDTVTGQYRPQAEELLHEPIQDDENQLRPE